MPGEEAAGREVTGGIAKASGDQPVNASGGIADLDSDADFGDADVDRVCLDCLALTGFSIIFSILAVVSLTPTTRQSLICWKSKSLLPNFSTPYPTRGPPPQA